MQRRIVIVGGGTAGWLTAAYLAATLGPAGPEMVLIESAEIGIIGVGEGSFPTLRDTLAAIGLAEADFMAAASATFKQGVMFTGWADGGDRYFHPFNLPYGGDAPGLTPYWLKGLAGDLPYADAVTVQRQLVEKGLAPKRAGDPDWSGPMNYAYHFDAARLADFLRGAAVARGVQRIEGTVTSVRRAGNGDIASVGIEGREPVAGDLFIDCSGFRALLIGEELGEPFEPVGDVLFNDRALAIQVPYQDEAEPIVPATQATAREAGWIWDIALQTRRGTGYVYSSRHTDDEAAEESLRRYLGPAARDLPARKLAFRTGFRRRQWVGNCIAIGLSAGFFEPLESTGIMLIEVAARMVADFLALGDPAAMAAASRSFNRLMEGRFRQIVEFLKLHYCVSRRRDTAYWRDNTDPASIPEGLADRLAQWKHRPPSRFDFVVDFETFLPPSYSYILYGMGFTTELGASAARYRDEAGARAAFQRVAQAAAEAERRLPSHRELLARYRATAAPDLATA